MRADAGGDLERDVVGIPAERDVRVDRADVHLILFAADRLALRDAVNVQRIHRLFLRRLAEIGQGKPDDDHRSRSAQGRVHRTARNSQGRADDRRSADQGAGASAQQREDQLDHPVGLAVRDEKVADDEDRHERDHGHEHEDGDRHDDLGGRWDRPVDVAALGDGVGVSRLGPPFACSSAAPCHGQNSSCYERIHARSVFPIDCS